MGWWLLVVVGGGWRDGQGGIVVMDLQVVDLQIIFLVFSLGQAMACYAHKISKLHHLRTDKDFLFAAAVVLR